MNNRFHNKKTYIVLGLIWLALVASLIGVSVYDSSTSAPNYATEEQLVGVDTIPGESTEDDNTAASQTPTAETNAVSPDSISVDKTNSDKKNTSIEQENLPSVDTVSSEKSNSEDNSTKNTQKKPDKSTNKNKNPTPTKSPKKQKKQYYTFTIECKKIISHPELWRDGLEEFIPSDGIYYSDKLTYKKNTSVYNALDEICKTNNILMESRYTPIYETYYVAGIGNLYEFDCGSESGWKYSVNGITPGIGSSRYIIEPGDEVIFYYDIAI